MPITNATPRTATELMTSVLPTLGFSLASVGTLATTPVCTNSNGSGKRSTSYRTRLVLATVARRDVRPSSLGRPGRADVTPRVAVGDPSR
jgi:hypothetical protein